MNCRITFQISYLNIFLLFFKDVSINLWTEGRKIVLMKTWCRDEDRHQVGKSDSGNHSGYDWGRAQHARDRRVLGFNTSEKQFFLIKIDLKLFQGVHCNQWMENSSKMCLFFFWKTKSLWKKNCVYLNEGPSWCCYLPSFFVSYSPEIFFPLFLLSYSP